MVFTSRAGRKFAIVAEPGAGPFENLEARMLIEPQVAAMAASKMTDTALAQLADAIAMMRWEHSQGRELRSVIGGFIRDCHRTGNATLVNIVDDCGKANWSRPSGKKYIKARHAHEGVLARVDEGATRKSLQRFRSAIRKTRARPC